MIRMTFGRKLQELRAQTKLTQQQVADAVGISRRTYVDYEKYGRLPRRKDTYLRLAKVLGVDLQYLMIEEAEEEREERTVKKGAENTAASQAPMVLVTPSLQPRVNALLEDIHAFFADDAICAKDRAAIREAIQMICNSEYRKVTNFRERMETE